MSIATVETQTFVNEKGMGGTPVVVKKLATEGLAGAETALDGVAGDAVVMSADSPAKVHLSCEEGAALSVKGICSAVAVLAGGAEKFTGSVTLSNGAEVPCLHEDSISYMAGFTPDYEEFPMEEMMPLLLSLGLSMGDVVPTSVPMIVDTGVKTLVMPVGLSGVENAKVNQSALDDLCAGLDLSAVVLLQVCDGIQHAVATFAPTNTSFLGLGKSTHALAAGCYLYDIDGAEETHFSLEEGANTLHIQMVDDGTGVKTPYIGGVVRVMADAS